MSRARQIACVAWLTALAGGCGDGRVVPWDIGFGNVEIQMRTRTLRATIQRGTCDRRSTVEFAHEYHIEDRERPDTKPLDDGSYAFVAQAVDANCVIVAESCQTVAITEDGPARVSTVLDQLAAAPALCDDCVYCVPSSDAGSTMDAASDDGGPRDAGPDASDGGERDAGMQGEDAGVDAGPLPRVECDGTCDCEALGYEGLCTDTTSIWWDMGQCWVRDCAAEGLACGFISTELGYGCMPVGTGTTTDPCSTLGSEGACFDDDTLVWFDDVAGECRWRHCPSMGRVCAHGGATVGFNCLPL